MRNYFIQLQELKTFEARLHTLIERKIRLKNKIKKCTRELKDDPSSSNFTNDKMTNYLIQLEELEEEILYYEQEICTLTQDLNMMEYALMEVKDTEHEIFLLKYKDNLKIEEIAKRKHYSSGRIYQYLDKINKKIGAKNKHYKKL